MDERMMAAEQLLDRTRDRVDALEKEAKDMKFVSYVTMATVLLLELALIVRWFT